MSKRSNPISNRVSWLFVALLFSFYGEAALAQGTAFTYQGKLSDSGAPANGNFDLQFKLFDTATAGAQQGANVTVSTVPVTGGIFTVTLDFGACATCFNGSPRFLEIAVKAVAAGSFTTLAPRQPVTSNPYAIRSLNAATADGLSVACVNFTVSGSGSANIFNAATQYNIGGNRILASPGGDNVFAGRTAGLNNNGAILNSFFGSRSGEANVGGSSNSFFGERSGLNSQGINNSFFGAVAGQSNVAGGNNTIIGTLADVGLPDLTFATAIGAGAVVASSSTVTLGRSSDTVQIPGALSVTGATTFTGTLGANIFDATTQYNIAGKSVLSNSGTNNLFVGVEAGRFTTTGSENAFFGAFSGRFNTTGRHNAFFGQNAGLTNDTGAGNTLIGADANVNTSDLSNATAIGWQAIVSQSNSLVLGSFGGFFPQFDTKVGIGTSAPSFKLHIIDSQNTGLRVQTNTAGGTVASFASNGSFQIDSPGIVGGRFIITEAGNVGINTNNPINKLDVAGIIAVGALGSGGGAPLCRNGSLQISSCSSSIRYKQNINSFLSGLSLIKQLRPVSFNWRATNQPDFGLVAEEVYQVEPLLTTTNDKGEIEGVKYDRVGVVLVNAVNEQQRQIDLLEKQNQSQQKQIERQQKQIDGLKQIVCSMNPQADICK